MHAYGGSKEFTDLLLKLGEFKRVDFYFGFASVINLKSPKTKDVIKHIPKDNILEYAIIFRVIVNFHKELFFDKGIISFKFDNFQILDGELKKIHIDNWEG